MVRKAVIPVAGLGTRVLPASKAIPKEMLPVVDKPAIQLVIEEAVQAGIKISFWSPVVVRKPSKITSTNITKSKQSWPVRVKQRFSKAYRIFCRTM